jgi:cytoskeleton protein RodZ
MTLGERVAAARQSRGLSLEELSRRTRIPPGGLHALEADAYERLPPPIFARGYIRAVAGEIGLDAAALVLQFEAERPQPPPPPPEDQAAGIPLDDAPPRLRRARLISLASAGALVIALAIWSGRDDGSVPHDLAAMEQRDAAAEAAASRPVGTTGAVDADQEVESVSVVLGAERVCWVAAEADGRRTLYRLLQPGQREVVTGRKRISLRIGDAGALTLSVNGGAPQLAGADGMVRTLVVSAGDPSAAAGLVAAGGSRVVER